MDIYVNSKDLGIILKITDRRVDQLAKEGVFSRAENKKFDVAESVENFYRYKFRADEKSDLNFDQEHALLEKAKRKKAELDLAERKGELLRANEVEKLMAGMILTCKARLLAMPTAVAPKVLGKNELPVVVDTIKSAVFEALAELKEMPAAEMEEPDDAENE